MRKKQLNILDGVWSLIGPCLSGVGALVLVRVGSDLLSPDQYGQLALLMTVYAFTSQVALGGLNAATARYYAFAAEKKKEKEYLKYIQKKSMFAFRVAFVCFGASVAVISSGGWSGDWIIWLLAVNYGIIGGLSYMANGILNASFKRFEAAAFLSGEVWLRIVLLVATVHMMASNATSAIVGYTIATVLIFFAQWQVLTKDINRELLIAAWAKKIKLREGLMQYASSFFGWTLLIWISQVSDRWILLHFTSEIEVGLYYAIFQLGYSSVSLLFTSIIRFLQPILYRLASIGENQPNHNASKDLLLQSLAFGGIVGTFLFTIAAIYHSEIFSVLLSDRFHSNSIILPWFVLSGSLFGMSEIVVLGMQANMDLRKLNITKSLLAIFSIILNYVAVLVFGFVGIVGALVVLNVISLIVILVVSGKDLEWNWLCKSS